jgi:homoserine dehydrogenase
VVGEGIYTVLQQTPRLGAEVKKVVIKNPEKSRNAPKEIFSTNALDILNDDEITLVVELIDDAEAAYEIVTKALRSGKSVVSANKKMIAKHHKSLIELAKSKGVSFLYEAAVCGSIPILRNLEEYYDNDLLKEVYGIVNGSTNFILSKMNKEGLSYEEALSQAQALGFAESNPNLDVEAWDALFKLQILVLHAFGKFVEQEQILRKGINALTAKDFVFAKEKNLVVKLIAQSSFDEQGHFQELSVLPSFLPEQHPLSQTSNEFNGVLLRTKLADEQFLYGKGAGRFPTSSAVLSDISALTYGYQYEYKKITEEQVKIKDQSQVYFVSTQQSGVNIDTLFEEVEEQFDGKDYRYRIGKISRKTFLNHPLVLHDKVSIIRYWNEA